MENQRQGIMHSRGLWRSITGKGILELSVEYEKVLQSNQKMITSAQNLKDTIASAKEQQVTPTSLRATMTIIATFGGKIPCAKYIKLIKERCNIDAYAISLQNEPAFVDTYRSCVYTPEQFRDLIKVAGG